MMKCFALSRSPYLPPPLSLSLGLRLVRTTAIKTDNELTLVLSFIQTTLPLHVDKLA